ncbi:Golgi CORVET complex core vacuolar protein 8-domain-containing protein [Microdochium trichocladiopsis]|uniref:Golgi CORVET complex core vacuolar protein 8-domain-containing protein n=1 Tax=Microdochium trichocladiopsis TaxID=1682393 RepID=A0A9P8Y4Z3_9PEZI|nr:Golgi CORVET complex core vacuolar protein 8-domain-containing protein [Microdochium trichocladiopsis]KAH7027666.1 Golgi CORVET complex core vacuolar protein 8-domain-containing protein [Microdochium trichocladiopsis]
MDNEDQLDLAPEAQRANTTGVKNEEGDDNPPANGDQEHLAVVLEEERRNPDSDPAQVNGILNQGYRHLLQDRDDASESGSADGLPRRAGSPIDSLLSVPDDSPSVQGSVLSSPGSSLLPSIASRPGLNSPTPSFRPFDRRFQSRIPSSSSLSPRPSSPAFLGAHSRNVSLTSNIQLDSADTETPSPPWEVVRWTRLNKLNGQAFSEAGKRSFGSPTCIAVSTSIVIGTSKGIILMFDYNQNLKTIIGPGTKAVESGAITAVAISADQTAIAGGHANGNIFIWDTSRASRPFLDIPHLEDSQLANRTVDGHFPNVAITHLGFLGTRRTALVSADDRGMAFSHLATRGTGALGRTVKTVRILGRYPNAPPPSSGKPLKPSTVLAFSPLPLGNVELMTDSMGLTAMLTPYLLVIVSTTPIAQTQHKSARPKDVAPHSAMSGCLAWYPAVKLKVPDPHTGSTMSKVKLVYCWSNILTVLDIDEIPSEDKDKPPTLKFRARSRWKCEEAIVAVQWLSRSVLTVLTITQRLIVLEDRSMRMTEAFDLIHKHIYHADIFSSQLHNLVEQLDEEDVAMHGVVADAFYMSLKTYKGRIFLMGFNDVSIGALSNWADRLIALMEDGDYVGAIQLATSYYTGDANKLTIGLPEDTDMRHQMVLDKLMEIMSASLKYVFGQRQKTRQSGDDHHLRELAETCFTACQSVGDMEFLFDEMYEWYEDADVEGIFLEVLEPYILERAITSVPPAAVKAIVLHFVGRGWESRLEDMLVHMDTSTLDIDQVTLLCKQHSLYDALIYVWNQALSDYITPLIDLLSLLVPFMQNGEYVASGSLENNEIFSVNALKMFPYLSYTLTGRIYPTGDQMDESRALRAKAELYWFLFSGQSITWPKGGESPFLTRPSEDVEPSFPYLRMILKFDAPSFLSTINEAFEDSFLNDSPEKHLNGNSTVDLPEEQIFGRTVDRQYVVSILLEIMNSEDFAPEDTIYLDMFIARNLPKFPQYLLISGSTLNRVIAGLCNFPGTDLAEDAQLSAEYLLSVYQPPDMASIIPLFKQARFFRILKRTYKTEEQYGNLIDAYFEDPDDRNGVFDCISECLRSNTSLSKKSMADVLVAMRRHSVELVELDAERTAQTVADFAPELHQHFLESLDDGSALQYSYLRALLEPVLDGTTTKSTSQDRDLVEMYVRLMCHHDPSHVSDYIGSVQNTDLRLDHLLPTMEETNVIDAAVTLMARDGKVQDAMARLTKHLGTLESALHGILSSTEGHSDEDSRQAAAEDILNTMQRYTHVGIWLCQGHMKSSRKSKALAKRPTATADKELSSDEKLWLELIDASVKISRSLSPYLDSSKAAEANGEDYSHVFDSEKLLTLLRSLVQHTFTALLAATSTQGVDSGDAKTRVLSGSGRGSSTFLRILRAFLTTAATSSPSLADLRQVLTSIFSAYAYEENILQLSNRLLEQQLFANVKQAVELRQRGWRSRGSTCEACGSRVWGPGVSGNVFEAWEEKQAVEEQKRAAKQLALRSATDRWKGGGGGGNGGAEVNDGLTGKGKGKGKSTDVSNDLVVRPKAQTDGLMGQNNEEDPRDPSSQAVASGGQEPSQNLGPLVVLACRHIYHQRCLDMLQAGSPKGDGNGVTPGEVTDAAGGADYAAARTIDDYGRVVVAYRCPIDG